jgi:hypothetical protein
VFAGETSKLPPQLRIFDETKLASGAIKPENPIAIEPPIDEDDGGGHGGKGAGGGRGRGEVEQPSAAQPSQPVGPAPADEFSKPIPERLALSVNAVLLDVSAAPVPAGPGKAAPTRAFVRDVDGRIVPHSPDALQSAAQPDTMFKLFERVMRNAKLGESQGRPATKPAEGAAPPGQRPKPEETPGPGDGGGGDDGGGGGG